MNRTVVKVKKRHHRDDGAQQVLDQRKRRNRRVVEFKLPTRIRFLFFALESKMNRNTEILNEFPRVYKLKNFLSKEQLLYFDKLCSNKSTQYKRSFTEDEYGTELISPDRTSRFLCFERRENRYISLIEKKAADLVGLSVDNVEPIQLVAYSGGEYFNIHHDAG